MTNFSQVLSVRNNNNNDKNNLQKKNADKHYLNLIIRQTLFLINLNLSKTFREKKEAVKVETI